MSVTLPGPIVITLVSIRCCVCSVPFAMPTELKAERRKDRATFWCPNGHAQSYTRSEASDLKDELAAAQAKLDQEKSRVAELRSDIAAQHALIKRQDSRINGYKGVVAKTKRRVSNGVCPCCSAKFKDLKQHMQTEHPHWDPDKGAEAMAG